MRNCYTFLAALLGLAFAAAPAAAQTAEAVPGDGSVETFAEGETPDADAAKTKLDPPSLTILAKVAPVIAGNAPLEDEERLTDYQTNSLSASLKIPLVAGPAKGLGLDFVGEGGLKHNLDVDDDSTDDDVETGWYGSAKLEWLRGVRRLSPFVSYKYEKGFVHFFDDRKYADQTVSTGATFTTSRYLRGESESMSFYVTAAVDRVWSDDGARERWTPRVAAELKGELARGLKWSLTATGERRIFDKVGPDRRLDWRFATFAGIDIAKLIDPKTNALRELKFGVRWTVNESNVDAKDFSNFNLLPVFTVGTKIPLGR